MDKDFSELIEYFDEKHVLMRQSFTVIELLVIIATIAILSNFVYVNLAPSKAKARDAVRMHDLRQLQSMFEMYQIGSGVYPLSTQDYQIEGHPWGSYWEGYGTVPKDPLPTQSYAYVSDGSSYQLYVKFEKEPVNPTFACAEPCGPDSQYNGGLASYGSTLVAFKVPSPPPSLPEEEKPAPEEEKPGWLPDWDHQTLVFISGSKFNLTDYQVKVSLQGNDPTANNYIDFEKIKTKGEDIRFTDSDGRTLIPYYIESWDDISKTAIIWVKIPEIPTDVKKIYIYYGNTEATSLSNGDATFIFFDDFEKDLSKWNIPIGKASLSTIYAYQGSRSVEAWGASYAFALLEKSFDPPLENVAVHTMFYDLKSPRLEKHDLAINGFGTDYAILGVYEGSHPPVTSNTYFYRLESAWYDTGINREVGWHSLVIKQLDDQKEYVLDGKVLDTIETKFKVWRVRIGSRWSDNEEDSYWDYFYIRQYVSPEPTVNF